MATKCVALVLFIYSITYAFCIKHQRSVNYNGYALYRVYPNTKEEVEFLDSISSHEANHDIEVDFWNFPESFDEYAEVLVAPRAKEKFERDLKAKEITFEIIYDDIQRAIDEEMSPSDEPKSKSKSRKRLLKDGAVFDVSKYNSWEDIESYLRKLPENYPSIVSIQTIGTSHEGRPLLVLKVGAENSEQQKPAIWIDSAIHAREWIAPATTLYILDNILYSYQTSHKIKRYLDDVNWYFLPVMNPDGYVHSFTKDRMWRKNRSPNNCTGQKKCCVGVDLNRNFGFQWGGSGASSSRCSNTYAGVSAFSEPETKAVRDFVLQNSNHIKAFLTYHSYAQALRYPFAWKRNTYPEDIEELRALAKSVTHTLQQVHGVKYKVGTGDKNLSGVSRDWAKAEAKIKYVYCVELASRGNGFVASTRSIVPSGEENWAALTILAEKIIEKYVNVTITNSTTDLLTTPISPPEKISYPSPRVTVASTYPSSTSKSPSVVGGDRSAPKPAGISAPSNSSSSPGPCDDLITDCAQQYDQIRCYQDIVVRTVCKKYCGACRRK